MALSNDLINQFAKITTEKKEEKKETVVNGVYKTINGKEYVQIDGSNIWTPVTSTVEAEDGERVKVTIKNHAAVITANITSPMARTKSVQNLKDEVDEFGNSIRQLDNTIIQQGNSIIQIENNINQQGNTINQHNNAINQHNNAIQQINNAIEQENNDITQLNNRINQQGNDITEISNTVISQGNTITQHNNRIQQIDNTINQQGNNIEQIGNNISQINNTISQFGNTIDQQGNSIIEHNDRIVSIGNNIEILNSGFTIINGRLVGLSEIVVENLDTTKLRSKYVQIDYGNIDMAWFGTFFSESGIIKDVTTETGKVTGELVGVTIKGDLIEGNTIVADKLVILGSDGIYYKLNTNGSMVESEQTDYNSLNGSIITAKSITASKIAVTDLVAFGATIGGFHIDEHSIYSRTKIDVHSNSPGVYMNDNGELSLGDDKKYLKYYKLRDEYTLLETEPADWNEAYQSYYIYNSSNQEYRSVTPDFLYPSNSKYPTDSLYPTEGTIPLFKTNTYYRKYENYTIEICADTLKLSTSEQTLDKDISDMEDRLEIQIGENERKIRNLANVFQLTSGSNLIQNSVGYLSTNETRNKPIMWNIENGTVNWEPFGYDDDLIGDTISRGKLTIANGKMTTSSTNIKDLNINSVLSLSFKYKNAQGATSKIRLYNGNITYFEKTFNTKVDRWTEYINNTTDGAKNTFYILGTTTLFLEISSTNTDPTSNDGFEISDLMLNYGDVKSWELYQNEVFGSIIRLSSLGIEVAATTAKTITYMTTDGVQVFQWTPDETNPYKGTVGELITKLTDEGIVTNKLIANGDIVQTNLITTKLRDEYTLLETEPADWNEAYQSYYIYNSSNQEYRSVTPDFLYPSNSKYPTDSLYPTEGTIPSFKTNTYYRKYEIYVEYIK